MSDQPLISDAYRARVEALVARACAGGGGTLYERRCLAGWRRELERLNRGEVY